MSDDWRVTVPFDGKGVIGELMERVRAGTVEHEAAERLGGRVAVSHSGDNLFLYAENEADARTAETVVRDVLAEHGLAVDGETQVEQWHPEEERWEDASTPLPKTADEHAAEHARLMETEAAESRDHQTPQWEVRVTLPTEQAARDFEAKLKGEGMPVVRRAHHVMAGANTEDDAAALSDRLRSEAPEGAEFAVDGNGQAAWSALHPFAFLGGLGA